ncbi:MAG: flagellar basal body rod protein FlgC [Desulfopila sp.]|jgi:flagellar basal-body rod protein FlgC|nr:flagellar basal body rod protein FlgC [Desulfopila sp.]
MDIFTSIRVASSALQANSIRLNTISSNLANIETTSTPEGGPYKRKSVYFQTTPLSFQEQLNANLRNGVQGVKVTEILEDTEPPKLVFKPDHPDANEEGYVAMPNINLLEEMVDMMNTTRAYESNTTTIKSAKKMALKALEIGR